MILVTILYLLTNISYLSVLGVSGLLDAEAVGTSFARNVLGKISKSRWKIRIWIDSSQGSLRKLEVHTIIILKIFKKVGLDRVIPVMIMTSVFGTCLISCFTASRVPFVAAREGQFPSILSMIHVTRMTPVPAVIFNGLIASLMIFPNDFESLVNYFSHGFWYNFGNQK